MRTATKWAPHVLAVSVSLFGLVPMAYAQNVNLPVTASAVIRPSEQAATKAYWTAERMANAKPMPTPEIDPATASVDASPLAPHQPPRFSPGGLPTAREGIEFDPAISSETLEPVEPETTAATVPFSYEFPFTNYRPPTVNVYPYTTVGKLFFSIPTGATLPAGNYFCTASVVGNNHTIMTARHCMYDVAKHKWYQGWLFKPAYSNGTNPLWGSWAPRKVLVWGTGTTNDWDIGFMQMNDLNFTGCNGSSGTKPIGYYTGWLGYTYGGSYAQRQWDVFGYPQTAPFNGAYMYQDEAATGTLNPNGTTNIVEIGDPQTSGADGGPWIIGFNPLGATDPSPSNNTFAGGNYVNGLSSFKWKTSTLVQPLATNGPAFSSSNFYSLWLLYTAQTCP